MHLTSFSDFLNHCHTLKNVPLQTESQKKPFSIEIINNNLWFIPLSSGKRRKANPEKVEFVLTQLNKTGSHSPSKYKLITRHASYILAVANNHAKNILTHPSSGTR